MINIKYFSVVTTILTLTACSQAVTPDAELEPENTNQTPSTNNQIMQLEPQSGDTIATISTNKGEIKILLYADKTPQTVANFVGHAEDGNYNGTVFHRVMKDFMIQTGDFENNNGTGGYPHTGKDTVLEDEYASGLTHVYGAVSMANIGVPNTGGSQFFIVQKADGTSWLNGGHSVFGYVFEGMEVVEEIAATETDASDRPLEDIIMETVTISQF